MLVTTPAASMAVTTLAADDVEITMTLVNTVTRRAITTREWEIENCIVATIAKASRTVMRTGIADIDTLRAPRILRMIHGRDARATLNVSPIARSGSICFFDRCDEGGAVARPSGRALSSPRSSEMFIELRLKLDPKLLQERNTLPPINGL